MKPLPSRVRVGLANRGRGLTLAVLRLSALGDVLRTLPALGLLRSKLPDARLLWIVEDRWHDVVDGLAELDATRVVPRTRWRRELRSPGTWGALARSVLELPPRLREPHIDVVLDFQGNLRSGIIGRLSGAEVIVGFAGAHQKEGNRLLSTHRVDLPKLRISRIDRNFALLAALDIRPGRAPIPVLPLLSRARPSIEQARIDRQIGGRPVAIVVPGASSRQPYKAPPHELLAAACGVLSDRGIEPVVVYGPGEIELARQVVERSAGAARLAPPTDLATLARLLSEAELCVAGDSGPLHLGCAVGCPVVAIYGPTDPLVNAPWGVPCRSVCPPDRRYSGVKRKDRAHGFQGARVQDVADAVQDLLAELADGGYRREARREIRALTAEPRVRPTSAPPPTP